MPLNGGREFADLNSIAMGKHERALMMSAGTFEKTNLGWQIQQFQQQVGEWLALQFSKLFSNLPEVNWPSTALEWGWLYWLFNGLFWILVGLLVSWLVLQLLGQWPALLDTFHLRRINGNIEPAARADRPLTADLWLVQAQEFQRQGNYRQACRALYMAMLQRLNDTGVVPGEPSRTDGEYRQLLQQQSGQVQPYQVLIATHEDQCFGDADATLDDFNRCQQAYREIKP